MTCQACASRIEKVLNKKDFVESAGVNFASEEAQVTFDDSKTSAADIAKIIEKTGYGAKEKTEDALPQPEGAYFLNVTARGADGRNYNIKKTINLLRRYDAVSK